MGIEETNEQPQTPSYEKDYAFRIYKIFNNSPLKHLGIKELSDFIIPPNELYTRKISFQKWLQEKNNQNIKLKIFSLLTKRIKEIEITLNNINNNNEEVLGCSLNFENYKTAERKLLHVLKVKENSFAQESLYLIENQDYLIGIKSLNDGKYYSINNDKLEELIVGFIDILNRNKGKECEFYIYNIKRGPKIIMTKIPDDSRFSLGCDVAYGRIHEFPIKIKEDDEEKKSLKE